MKKRLVLTAPEKQMIKLGNNLAKLTAGSSLVVQTKNMEIEFVVPEVQKKTLPK